MSRPHLALAVIVLAATAVGLNRPEPTAADPPPCHHDYCTGDEISLPGETTPTPATPAGDGGRPGGVGNGSLSQPAPRCTWVSDPGPLPGGDGAPGAFPDVGPRRSLDDYLIFERCDGELTGRVQWASPTAPMPATTPGPVAPTPAELAGVVRVRLEGDLPDPVAATSPPAGQPAVVNHPTFLAIDNWTGTITDRECALLLCVTVTATPSLGWTPGEPGAAAFRCAGSGTRFDPNGSSPQAQASEPNACAHAYQSRTGTAGRPDEWPGVATVTWQLAWTSTSGAGGDLPAIARSTDVARAVEEVQAIVVR